VTVAYPEKLLGQDERVVLHLHPHWKVLVWPVFVLIVAAGGGAFGIALISTAWLQIAIAVVAVLLILFLSLRPFLRWKTTHFVFTTHRVLTRYGILSRAGRDIPLSRVNDVSFQHNLWERMLGCGTLVIESAGEHGQLVLSEIPHVESVQATLTQLREEYEQRDRDEPNER
jgi:uncharacterized membrane protein YdbT with pleckstrin-like domain